jgi:RNA polymerase sigma-70 factor (ECF subfamily)
MAEDVPSAELHQALAEHRPALLRHCYRMMGSFADAEDALQDTLLRAWRARDSYTPDAPIRHWLMRIATNACLSALESRKARGFPPLEGAAHDARTAPPVEGDASRWITPAPDEELFRAPDEAAEARESVALAFVAVIQRLPPRQRAVLLLKDVVGWSAEEIAGALELSVPSVSSALHRAREAVERLPKEPANDPPPPVLSEYVRSWEDHDVDALVRLLKEDVVLAMPPLAAWVHGARAVEQFYRLPRFEAFWSKGVRGVPTRANALPAVAWYLRGEGGRYRRHSIEVARFVGGAIASTTHFVGAQYVLPFAVPEWLE